MRYYPKIYPYIYNIFDNNITRIGCSNLLKNQFIKQRDATNKINIKIQPLELHSTVNTNSCVAKIINSQTVFHFPSPYKCKIINVNTRLINNPELLLKNDEDSNWLVDIEKFPINNINTDIYNLQQFYSKDFYKYHTYS